MCSSVVGKKLIVDEEEGALGPQNGWQYVKYAPSSPTVAIIARGR